MHEWGRAKENKASWSEGHMPAWPASITHMGNKGTLHTPRGGQQADHSQAAESGGIHMHIWGRAKENKAGRSEGHMPA
jgi:hypothetical protein